jgi:transcriptional antiterminator
MQNSQARTLEIISLLSGSLEYVSVKDIARKLNVSARTIRSDIEKLESNINECFSTDEVCIEKKSGSGIRLKVKASDFNFDRLGLNSLAADKAQMDNSTRRIEIMNMLINSNEELTTQFLADQFYVSKSIILKDLDWINIWLKQYNLGVEKRQNKGVYIMGGEKDMRNAIAAILKMSNVKPDNTAFKSNKNLSKRLSDEKYNEFFKIYPKINANKIGDIIRSAEKEFAFFMPEEHFNSMFTHLVISIGRLQKGIKVKDESDLIAGQCNDIETQVARYIVTELENNFDITIPQAEFAYICMHLMGLNIYSDTDRLNINDALLSIPSNIKTLVYEIVRYVGNILNEDFTDDKVLLLGLMFYLKTSVFRLKNNAQTGSFELMNSEYIFTKIYMAVWTTDILYKKYADVAISSDEAVEITRYFMIAFERKWRRNKAIIVSDASLGTAIEIRDQIKKNIPQIQIIDICSYYQLNIRNYEDCDFLISTMPLSYKNKPVLQISNTNNYYDSVKEIVSTINAHLSKNKKSSFWSDTEIQAMEIDLPVRSVEEFINELEKVINRVRPEEVEKLRKHVRTCLQDIKNSLHIEDVMYIKLIENSLCQPFIIRCKVSSKLLINNFMVKYVNLCFLNDNNMQAYGETIKNFLIFNGE